MHAQHDAVQITCRALVSHLQVRKQSKGAYDTLANHHKSTMQGWHLVNKIEVLSCTARSKSERSLAEMGHTSSSRVQLQTCWQHSTYSVSCEDDGGAEILNDSANNTPYQQNP